PDAPGVRGVPDAPGVRGVPEVAGVRGVPEVVVGVDAVDLIASGKVNLVVNTPRGRGPRADGAHIRLAASAHGVPCLTTIAAALAAAAGIAESRTEEPRVRSLQEYHRDAQLRLPL
ncbi:MAG: carbamoyl-phosphate synthase large subunit, partial [Actinomycetota bacterium]|nr:carbamoyl-phosphate synthase large subunit [Actinomycetota bacterium]